jgi:leucyl aminopeptidase (aminopeptidase T)
MVEGEKPYLDFEKEMFDKLSSEEQKQKVVNAGTLEVAIQQHGLEQTLKSMDKPEIELTPEEQEKFERMITGARNVIDAFEIKRSPDGKKGENLTIVTDSGADELFVKALYQAGREKAGNDCRVVISEMPTGPAQSFGKDIGERLKNSDCLLLVTSFSRSHSQEMVELISPHANEVIAAWKLIIQNTRGGEFPMNTRIISITQTRPEILTDGAAQENLPEMQKRLERLKEIMHDAEIVKINSENGTNLILDIKTDKVITDDGKMGIPGKAANFPFGEWSSAVDLEGTNGILVIDGVSTLPVGELDQPITLKIEKGVVIDIQGGEAAKRLRSILDESNRTWRDKYPEDQKTNAYRIAELGIGVNSKAFRYKEGGEKIAPPTSLEGEKGLGTIHIALGKNSLFGVSKEDQDFNPISVHIDNVIMKTTTVAKKQNGAEISLIENGIAKF